VEQDTANEVIENLADFWVRGNIVGVGLDKFVFADRQVGQNFVVEIDVLVHYL
jgi:hypothetical protein